MRLMSSSTLMAAVVAAGMFTAGDAHAVNFTNEFVFGDSLNDTGNLLEARNVNFNAINANFPTPVSFHGSITNGPVALELLAENFGLRADPSLWLTGGADVHHFFGNNFVPGTNYAVAGAEAFDRGAPSGNIDLAEQVGAFLAHVGNHADPNALYTVMIGGNDVRNSAQGNFGLDGGGNKINHVPDAVAAEIAKITVLINSGARRILVSNVGDVGGIPEEINKGISGLATQESIQYNNLLKAALALLQSQHPEVDITLFDFFTFSANVALHAAALGITDTTNPCLANFAPIGNCTLDPNDPDPTKLFINKHLFWDNIHPTAPVQAAWAQGLIAAVPEPASLTLFGVALAGLAVLRRRKAA